ncbi:MAG: substrate-binding domain-containing protein [Devosia sp.]
MKHALFAGAAIIALASFSTGAFARDQIQIVGSSTVFPFSTAVAERFGQAGTFPTPVVESTGTGGGIKLFCEGAGEQSPDITNASRKIKDAEIDTCVANGVTAVEVKVGFDGIVLANSSAAPDFAVTLDQIVAALAKDIVVDGKVVPNTHVNWSDIDASLPNEKIEVLGPPPTSGTRDAFVELVMTAHCPAEIKAIDEKACSAIREDGAYIDSGENDNLIVQKLETNPAAVGIFGFSFLDQNSDKLKGASIGGVLPTFENIANASYPVSRSLYFYIKKEHVGVVKGIQEYAAEFTSDAAAGADGYLADKGLIPLPEADLVASRQAAADLTPVAKSK